MDGGIPRMEVTHNLAIYTRTHLENPSCPVKFSPELR